VEEKIIKNYFLLFKSLIIKEDKMEKYTQHLTEQEKMRSINALKCLNELRDTYRADAENTLYLLAVKCMSNPLQKNKDIVQELYSTTNGLVRKVFESDSIKSTDTRTISIDALKNLPALGIFSVSEEELSHYVGYFNLKPKTVMGVIDLVEKELKIDVDIRHLQTNLHDFAVSNSYL
jgi:hypothetical protein